MQPSIPSGRSDLGDPDARDSQTVRGVLSCAWRTPADADLRWRQWGEETLVYHGASGDTHCLNPLASAVLSRLQGQAGLDGEPLLSAVLLQLGLDRCDELLAAFCECLELFHDLGLIEPVDARR